MNSNDPNYDPAFERFTRAMDESTDERVRYLTGEMPEEERAEYKAAFEADPESAQRLEAQEQACRKLLQPETVAAYMASLRREFAAEFAALPSASESAKPFPDSNVISITPLFAPLKKAASDKSEYRDIDVTLPGPKGLADDSGQPLKVAVVLTVKELSAGDIRIAATTDRAVAGYTLKLADGRITLRLAEIAGRAYGMVSLSTAEFNEFSQSILTLEAEDRPAAQGYEWEK